MCRHVEKNKRRCENTHRFFIVFSSIFGETSLTSRAKRMTTSHVHKNRQQITCATLFFLAKKRSLANFWGLWPSGTEARPGGTEARPGGTEAWPGGTENRAGGTEAGHQKKLRNFVCS